MAWIENSVTKMLSDGGPDATYVGDGNWTGHHKKITLTVSTSGNYANWSISTYANSGTYVSVYLVIAGKVLYDDYYTSGIKNNGYSNSGSVWIGDASSVAIDFRILCSQDMHSSASRFENETVKYQTPLTRTNYGDGSVPSMTIQDCGDNHFSIYGTLGKAGTNNPLRSATLYYTTNGREPNGSEAWTTAVSLTCTQEGGNSYDITRAIPDGCTGVWAVVYCVYEHNRTNTGHQYKKVTYYKKPYWPGIAKVELTEDSFKNNRLTFKQDWTWEWTPAEAGNANTPVLFYRIRFYVTKAGEADPEQVPIYFDDDYHESYELEPGDWVHDIYESGTIMYLPVEYHIYRKLAVGDTIQLSVQAGAFDDYGNELMSNGLITSREYTIQNAGITNVKVNGEWVEGQVWIKANNEWHEAETVNVKVNGNWQESQ